LPIDVIRLFEEVASTALQKSAFADGSVCTLESCVCAGSPSKLSELLEKIALLNSQFGNNENLVNLFILATIRDDTVRSRRPSLDSTTIQRLRKSPMVTLLCVFEEPFLTSN